MWVNRFQPVQPNFTQYTNIMVDNTGHYSNLDHVDNYGDELNIYFSFFSFNPAVLNLHKCQQRNGMIYYFNNFKDTSTKIHDMSTADIFSETRGSMILIRLMEASPVL